MYKEDLALNNLKWLNLFIHLLLMKQLFRFKSQTLKKIKADYPPCYVVHSSFQTFFVREFKILVDS